MVWRAILILWFGCENLFSQGDATFSHVRHIAKELSQRPYSAGKTASGALLGMSYDDARLIQFRDEKTLYKNSGFPFAVQFLHVGPYLRDFISFREMSGSTERIVSFETNFFRYPPKLNVAPSELGFGGFRVYYTHGNA